MITESTLFKNNILEITELTSDSDNYVIRLKACVHAKLNVHDLFGEDVMLRPGITTAFPSTKGKLLANILKKNDNLNKYFLMVK